MLVKRLRDTTGKGRVYALLGLAGALMVAVALISGAAPGSQAQVPTTATPLSGTGTCTTPAAGSAITTCTFITTVAVAAGGTLTDQLTNPNGATITSLTGVPPGCAVSSGIGTGIVTISCAIASLGMPAGTVLTETVTEPSAAVAQNTPFVTQSVTYNANGAAPQVPVPVTEPCGIAAACATYCPPISFPVPTAPPAIGTCTIVPSAPTSNGGTLTVTLTVPSPATVQITSAPTAVGDPQAPCFLTTALPSPASPAQTASITYSCAVGASIPAPPVPGQLPINVTYTGTAAPTITVTENANGPGQFFTPFPEILNIAACPTLPPTVGSPSTCPALPTGFTIPAQAGETLAVQITGAVGQTLYVAAGGAPPTAGGCNLATPLPTSVTFPEGTVVISYSCPAGAQVFTSPAITVTNANGVAGTPVETVAVIAPTPPPGVPGPTTVSIVKTVSGIGGNPTVVPVTVTVTPPSGGGSSALCSASTTPTPNCSANANCINAANATLPPAPAAGGAPAISAGGPYTGFVGQPLQLFGTAVAALGAQIALCSWTFGDTSAPSRFLSPTHVWAVPGTYTATLTVTDSTGKTSTATAIVTIGATPPLCQQPLIPSLSGLSGCAGGLCQAASFNNQCRPVCPLTTETLYPNQCPGPATGNQVTINGPFQLQIDQVASINANINLPATSSLLPGDYIRFDFGDGAVLTNIGPQQLCPNVCAGGHMMICGDQTTPAFTGSTTCLGHQGIAPGQPQPVPTDAVFPAPTQATHSYTQPGTYNITVSVTFSDGSTSVAKTTATVTGAPASLPVTTLAAPTILPVNVPLQAGCNSVTLTFPDGTAIATVAAAVQGTALVSIYETPANAPQLAYYPDPSAASNLASVQHGDAATICVQGAGTLAQPGG